MKTKLAAAIACGASLAALSSAAAAQDSEASSAIGNEIVVTATKREESLQKVPFSINAQTAKDIQRSGAATLEDLSRNVAGLNIQNLGPGQSQVSVRGVSAGQVVRDQPGVKEQVGVYLDESAISLSLFTPDLDLFDLNRVETLRGPQGTLFGSGSMGGTIRYITNQPRLGRTEGTVEGGLSQIDGGGMGGELKGALNLSVGEGAALRAVGYWTHYAGFIDAIGPAAGKNINDVLNMTVSEAIEFFAANKQHVIVQRLQPLESVGLGYIKLGQNSSTLSGGENQRVKLAYFIGQEKAEHTMFIFDEPTTGLHFHDIKRLLHAFDALIERGHTIIVIEHNMDVIKCADHVIDLGPDGGDKGGNLVAEGTPEDIAACEKSITGKYLKEKL